MSKGNLIGSPYKDITATLELLDSLGVSPHDFEVLRKSSSWGKSVVSRILTTDRFLWAMLEIEQGAKKIGFIENDFRSLAKDEEKLRQVLAFLRVGGSGAAQQNIIDCDAVPFIPNGLRIEKNDQLPGRVRGQFVFDNDIKLYLSPNQQGGKVIKGLKLMNELAKMPVLPANVLDYWLKSPHMIPDELKKDENGKTLYTFFWGTIYRDSDGSLCDRYLYFYGGEWYSGYGWLGSGWGGDYPAAVRAS